MGQIDRWVVIVVVSALLLVSSSASAISAQRAPAAGEASHASPGVAAPGGGNSLDNLRADSIAPLSALAAGAPTPTSPVIDQGQSVTLTGSVGGGVGPYTFTWYSLSGLFEGSCVMGDNWIAYTNSITYVASPTSTLYYCYVVTDSESPPVMVDSPADLVTVNPALDGGGVTPSSATIDSGQSVTLTANPSGGTPLYGYQWYDFVPDGSTMNCPNDGSAISGATSASLTTAPAVTTEYCYTVTDSSVGQPSARAMSSEALVSVDPLLVAGSFTPSSPTIDAGQSVWLTANASGGTSAYGYQWYEGASPVCSEKAPIPGATSATYLAEPTGNSSYCYAVTDSSVGSPSALEFSAPGAVTVNSALVAGAVTPSSVTIDYGRSVTLTANPSGGTGPYRYQWYEGAFPGCSDNVLISGATNATYTAEPARSWYYCYVVTDSSVGSPNATEPSGVGVVTVNSTLLPGPVSPGSLTIDKGHSVTLTAYPSGGTPPYTYQWYQGSSPTCSSDLAISGATNSTYRATPQTTTYYCYAVSDASTNPPTLMSPTVELKVTTVSPFPPLLGLPGAEGYVLIGAIAAVAVVAGLTIVVLPRRRRKSALRVPPESVPPTKPSTPT